MLGTVDVAGENHAVVVDDSMGGLDRLSVDGGIAGVDCARELLREHLLDPRAQRQHLKAAGVGIGGARPVHEGGEASGFVDDVGTGLKIQVIGVGQDGLSAEGAYHLRGQCLDIRFGSNGNKRGGADQAVSRVNDAGASQATVARQARADLKSPLGRMRGGRGGKGRQLLRMSGREPVVVHWANTSSWPRPSALRIHPITG